MMTFSVKMLRGLSSSLSPFVTSRSLLAGILTVSRIDFLLSSGEVDGDRETVTVAILVELFLVARLGLNVAPIESVSMVNLVMPARERRERRERVEDILGILISACWHGEFAIFSA